jgi:hypothetical protein
MPRRGRGDNEEYDVNTYGVGDMKRDMAEIDDVHKRAYDPAKDNVIDTVFVSDSEGEDVARRAADAFDAQARRRGMNKSAQYKKVRGGYQVITYEPKRGKK